jgi:hypothetical protein
MYANQQEDDEGGHGRSGGSLALFTDGSLMHCN